MKVMLEWMEPRSGKRFARIYPSEHQADQAAKLLSAMRVEWKASSVDNGLSHLKVK